MDKLFLSVLNMSLTGAFVIAAICLARLPLKKAPKIISYTLWAVAGFRLVFPFSIESVFSLLPFKAQPIPPDIAMQPIPRIDSGIPFVNNAVSSVLPAAAPVDSVNPLQVWTFIGSWIWIIGVAVMLVYGVVSFFILKQKMRGAAPIEANIYEAENIKSPFVLGVFMARIYLPVGLSEHERGYILLHEQTHIRRCDHIVKFAAYFVLCLHWFNPLAWVAFLLMGADMEMSCDERVMKELGGGISDDYSMSLVRIATGRRILNGSPLAFGEGGMKERVKRVLNFKKPSRVIIVAAIALAAVLSVGFAVNRLSENDLVEFEVVLSNVTEYSRTEQFRLGDTLYSIYIVDGQIQTFSGMRWPKEVGFANDDFGKYRIYERDGYSIDEFIIVRDYGLMNPAIIYQAINTFTYGTYTVENGRFPVHIVLQYNYRFSIEIPPLSSFPPTGNYVIYGNKLMLTFAEDGQQCVFIIDNDYLIFESGAWLEKHVDIGTRFILSDLDNLWNSNFGTDYRPMIFVQGNLYGETNDTISALPDNAVSIGTVQKVVPQNEPMVQENFTSNAIPIGSEIFYAEVNARIIYIALSDGRYAIYTLLTDDEPAPNTYLPQIMHDGVMYYLDSKSQIDIEFELTKNTPRIKSTVSLTQIPQENGQANFGDVDAPYVTNYEGLYVLWNNKWTHFITLEQLTSSEQRNMTLDDVRTLAAKGLTLTEADLEPYYQLPVYTGMYYAAYPVDGGNYMLRFVGRIENGLTLTSAADSANGITGIDIRYYDVDKYITDGTRELVRPLPDAQETTSIVSDIIQRNLDIITSSPTLASNEWAYINAHKIEYDEIVALGSDALEYMLFVFEKQAGNELEKAILFTACCDILGVDSTTVTYQELLDACNDRLHSVKAPREIIMTISDTTPNGLSFSFENTSDKEYSYGEDYSLYVFKNNLWEVVEPIIENWGIDSIGYSLMPHSVTNKISVDWLWLYGELPSGSYSFQKRVLFIRSPGDFDDFVFERGFTIP